MAWQKLKTPERRELSEDTVEYANENATTSAKEAAEEGDVQG